MKKLLLIATCFVALLSCELPQRAAYSRNASISSSLPPIALQPKKVTNKYELSTPYGHKIEVELDYAVGSNGYIDNDAKVQYIVTNTGTKGIGENFVRGSCKIGKYTFDSVYRVSGIVFQFTTSDNKLIESVEDPFSSSSNELSFGSSTPAQTLQINVGNRSCIAVKPIRMQYQSVTIKPRQKK